MLDFHFARHQQGADLEIAGRTFPAHPFEHLWPVLLPIPRQIGEKALVERSARSLQIARVNLSSPALVGKTS